MSAHRSSTGWSWSTTERMTVRMSNGFLRSLLVAIGEDVADGGEVAGRMVVREVANVAVHRVGSLRAARETFSRSDIGVVVVREQNVARRLKVGRPVLRLAVGSHHTVVAADAEVVLGRHTTGVIEGLLAGQDHRAVRCHDQNALGVHQHRRFGVPIRLRPDVDSRDDDVDLTTVLGEGDDSAKRAGHPVHVLGAALHRNGGAGGQGRTTRPVRTALRRDRAPRPPGRIRLRPPCPSAFVGSPNMATRVMPSGYRGVRRVTKPTMSPAVLRPYGRSTGTNSPDSSKSYSTNLPSLPVRSGISSYG